MNAPPVVVVVVAVPTPAALIDSPGLIVIARSACAVLAVASVIAVGWMIAAGARGLPGGAYVLFLAFQVGLAVLFGFLAAHCFAPAHAATFGGVALAAAAANATMLGLLLYVDGSSSPGLGRLRLGLLLLTLAAGVAFGLVRHPVATAGILLQAAHRAIAVVVWLLIARLILGAWGRPFPWVAHLLPVAFGLTGLAAVCSLTILYASRGDPDPEPFGEARRLTRASIAFLVPTLAWLIASGVFATR